MEPSHPHDYELEVTAERSALVVRLRGRVTAEAGRHIREVITAAAKCGLPVAVSLPGRALGTAQPGVPPASRTMT
jgi:hypothetical protein